MTRFINGRSAKIYADFTRRYRLEFLFRTGQRIKNSKHINAPIFYKCYRAVLFFSGVEPKTKRTIWLIIYRREKFSRTGKIGRPSKERKKSVWDAKRRQTLFYSKSFARNVSDRQLNELFSQSSSLRAKTQTQNHCLPSPEYLISKTSPFFFTVTVISSVKT